MPSSLPDDWSVRNLYDLATFQNGRATKPAEVNTDGHGVAVIKIAELNRGISRRTNYVDEAVIDDKHRISEGDLLFAWSGSVGIHVYSGPDAVVNQHIFKVVAGAGMHQGFLRYLLEAQMPRFEALVEDQRTTMGHVKVRDLKSMRVAVPPRDGQKVIAEMLGALDDRITYNSKLVRTLDALEAAHFDEWCGESVETTRQRSTLDQIAEFVNGRNFTKEASGTGRMVIRIAELNSGPGNSTVYNDVDAPAKHLADPGDLLFAWSGSLGAHRWYRDQALVNQHIFKVIPREFPDWFVAGYLRRAMPLFISLAADRATTMGHIKRSQLAIPEVLVLPGDHMERVGALLDPVRRRWLLAQRESLNLEGIRDALLPKLISGELRIPDAEKLVEKAL